MAEQGRVAVLDAVHGSFDVRSYEVPEPGPGEFVIKVDLTGICGTDVHIWHGHLPSIVYPIVLGHEITGTVVALGEGVTHDYIGRRVRVGDRVALSPGASCMR